MSALLELGERLAATPDHERQAVLHHFLRTHTFPIVEGNRATFVFYDGHDIDSVHLVHWVFGLEGRQQLKRIPGTNAFQLALELPNDARVEYKYEVQRFGNKTWERDPLNDRQAFDPFGSNSVCPMGGYSEPPWAHPEPGVRGGTLESLTLHSPTFGEERTVKVYLPVEYRPYKKYPLLICHDGSDYLRFATIKTVLDNLIHRHEVQPLIVAFTDGGARNEEYGANDLQVSWLVDELLPAVREVYGVSDDWRETGLMGASFGGVSSLYTAWQRPGVFGRLLLQSGSFAFTDIGHHGRSALWDPVVEFVNAFRSDPGKLTLRAYLSCGTFESLIVYNRAMAPLLRKQGIDVRFREARDGHNWINWRDRLREGLTFLYPGHLMFWYD